MLLESGYCLFLLWMGILDDVVVNETFSFPDLKLEGRIINIDSMQ